MLWAYGILPILLTFFPLSTLCSGIWDRSNAVQRAARLTPIPPKAVSSNGSLLESGSPDCFFPTHYLHKVDIDICRPILDAVLKLGDPSRTLYFIYGREPVLEHPPPFTFGKPGVACEIHVNTRDRTRVAELSWQRVHDSAYFLLVECARRGRDRGGQQQISAMNGWFVSVSGPISPTHGPSILSSASSNVISNINASHFNLDSGHGAIHCHDRREYPRLATVDLCRPILAQIHSWPSFSRTQTFEEFMLPGVEINGKRLYPPFRWSVPDGNCVIELSPLLPGMMDEFSFSDVKSLATDILESCEHEGNHGGTGRIGGKQGWFVNVFGSRTPRPGIRDEIRSSK